MKRLTNLILALLLMVGVLVTPTMAVGEAYTFTLTANGKTEDTVMVGDIVTLSLLVRSNSAEEYDLYAMQDYINFDPAYLEYIPGSETFYSYEGYPLISGMIRPGGRQMFVNRFGRFPLHLENDTALIQFDVKAMKEGTADVTHSVSEMLGQNAERYSVELVDASVTIRNPHVHTMELVPEVPATEQADGRKEHWVCTGCGKLFLDEQGTRQVTEEELLIPKKIHVHDMVFVPGREATESILGLKEHWTCKGCGKLYLDKAGTQETTKDELIIPKKPHVHTLKEVPELHATVQSTGMKAHWLCTGCGKLFADADAKREVLESELVIPKLKPEPVKPSQPESQKPSGVVFTDVAPNAWYAQAVKWAVENNITKGTSDTTFSPDAVCTRAQAVTFLWKAAGAPAPKNTDCPFQDVPANAYYRSAVLWALENGVTRGTSATRFSPDATCTRGQIVTFLWNAEGAESSTGAMPFRDVSEKDWYAQAVHWAVANKITSGVSETSFAPNASCTRSQIVTFLWKAQ